MIDTGSIDKPTTDRTATCPFYKIHGTSRERVLAKYIYSYANLRSTVFELHWGTVKLRKVWEIQQFDISGTIGLTEWEVCFDRIQLAKLKLLHPERWRAFKNKCDSYERTSAKLKTLQTVDITDKVVHQLYTLQDIDHEYWHPTAHMVFNVDIG